MFGGLDGELKFLGHIMSFDSTKIVLGSVSTCTLRAIVKEVTRSFTAQTDSEIL